MAANPSPHYIADAFWTILWEKVKAHFGSKVKLGGIYANKSGYHNTRKANVSWNYSVRRPVDKLGPSDKASAIDWTFPAPADMKTVTSRLLKAHDDPNDPRVGPHNIGDFYGTVDGKTVVGRQHGKKASSDKSHLWHVHLSVVRKYTNDAYTARAIVSVVIGETLDAWMRREHPEKFIDKYVVVEGDNLTKIAEKTGKTVEELSSWNNIKNPPAEIFPGQVLVLKAPAPPRPAEKFKMGAWSHGPRDFYTPYLTASQARGLRQRKYIRDVPPSYSGLKQVQKKLKELGYNVGTIDGQYGYLLCAAIRRFQDKENLTVDGLIGPGTWNRLRSK